MRRIMMALLGTLGAVVALFSYHTSTSSRMTAAAPAGSETGPAGTTNPTSPTGGSAGSSGSGSRTFTGEAADTQWGVVQVAITVNEGKITKSEAVQYPSGNGRDQEINAYAVPQLNSEAVQSQSGSIDAVSGATVTSGGYIQSLQSAIDAAGL